MPGFLVETFDQLAHRDHGRQQFAAIFVAGEAAEEILGLGQRVVDGVDAVFGGRDDAGDLLAVTGQRGREGLEIPQRILDRHLIVGDHPVDVAQRRADFFLGVERPIRIRGQLWNAVRPLWRRRRLVGAAGERDRRNARQPLKLEADLGIASHRRVAVDHGERDDAARMVELERHHLADPDAGEIHAAALAQAGRRAFEDHPERHLLLGADELLIAEKPAQRSSDQGQDERADHQIAGANLHRDAFATQTLEIADLAG